MKLRAVFLCAAMVAAVTGVAQAGGFRLGPTLGIGVPYGDFGDFYRSGFNLGGTATYDVSDQFGFGVDVAYHKWKTSAAANSLVELAWAGLGFQVSYKEDLSAIQATAHGQYNFPTAGSAKPYLRAGAGLYNLKDKFEFTGDIMTSGLENSKSEFGFNVGMGVNIQASELMAVGINGLYHFIAAKDLLGIDLNTATVSVSLLWKAGGK